MNDPESREPNEAESAALTTVLNRVRPTVVVRRRVYEVAREQLQPGPPAGFVSMEDDEDGPPSSVNVARALASLRGEELHRLEQILAATDNEPEPPAPTPSEPKPTSVKSIPVASTITVPELAKRMGIETKDLVTTLVAGGYFSTTAKSVLSRANATAAAWMFGWTVEAVEDEPAKKTGATKKKK